MVLAGLPLTTLLAIGGVFAALTCVLYILKLRRRPVAVPFAALWNRVLRDQEATRLFSHLKRLLSLLLQLVLLGLLVFSLGDPRLGANISEGRNIVVLVDTSASMKATDVAPSRIEVAADKVRELVRGLGAADRMLVAQMDASLTPLSTLTAELGELNQAVDALRATDTRADLERGLRFALDSLRELPRPEVIVVSDGALGDLPDSTHPIDVGDVALSFIPVGTSDRNVAVTAFSVRRYPLDKSRYEVLLEVLNTNAEPADVEVTLYGDGDVVDVTRLRLGPEESLPRFYPDLGGASRTLEASVRYADGSHDALPADDRAYALMPERRRTRVLVVTPGNTYLEAALLLDEYLDVTVLALDAYPPSERFDVAIFDGVAPDAHAAADAVLYLNPPAEGGPLRVGKSIEDFGFDSWEKDSPLLRWMAIENIQVARGHRLEPEPGDSVIGRSDLGPLLVRGTRGATRFVALGFDPRESDMVLRVAWPLFILNTINQFVEEDTSYVASFRTGEVWRVPTPSSGGVAMVHGPGGRAERAALRHGRAVLRGDTAGFYRVTPIEGDHWEAHFAANLSDPTESHIAPVTELKVAEASAGAVSGFHAGVRRELWVYLLLAVIGASCIEWLTYHRRLTV